VASGTIGQSPVHQNHLLPSLELVQVEKPMIKVELMQELLVSIQLKSWVPLLGLVDNLATNDLG
jgi:hypothetical protein